MVTLHTTSDELACTLARPFFSPFLAPAIVFDVGPDLRAVLAMIIAMAACDSGIGRLRRNRVTVAAGNIDGATTYLREIRMVYEGDFVIIIFVAQGNRTA